MRSRNTIIVLLAVLVLVVLAYIFVPSPNRGPAVEDKPADRVETPADTTNTNSANPTADNGVVAPNLLVANQKPMELTKEILKEGQGVPIAAGQTAVVHYTGWLTDGTKFDSSVDRGVPFEFIVGAGQVIPGWDQGVAGMKVGEKCRLTIPSDLAYGDAGVWPIPGKATLVFEVELLGIK